ncbi:Grx4 family monothiol glutaredoxin [Blochmannia endosymbiont of Camponotus (Colobopsis) obliquus]|uniref:Grx4 family monothiol glutaredoxin n=1 Tax=Blochmannia endosymbiont of Camponotus (Colobopsis) obliquus TaxID=1505597 RepID=UPI00061A549E|nr:Grx4 family monothiol glutaredoxin [Blochmannia endosymbiont of Camponotus (Colobopsis) obliquus]AKC60527.1 Glutaredoxin-4 [Blochmannia endosymbiont of Camponotus (Colobopsis) obliquus]
MTFTIKKIKKQITDNPIILYMKGSPTLPNCGFSAKAAHILSACSNKHFTYIDVLVNPDIRTELPKIAGWPTFPQLWIDGNLIGGCDIIIDLYRTGELQNLINKTLAKHNIKDL